MQAFRSSLAGMLALTCLMNVEAQENPGSPAVPIKELAPPPPNPADGKHLIAPGVAQPTGGARALVATEVRQELQWWFEGKDTNKDGQLSRGEAPQRMRPVFSRADTDSDGSISVKEYVAYMKGTVIPRNTTKSRGTPAVPFGVEAFLDLPYAETNNPRQRLNLYLPKDPKSESPLPVIVFIHGGGWRKGDRSTGLAQLNRFLSTRQYAGVSIGYRLSDEAQWPAQIHDCKAALRWLKAHADEYFLDPNKIGVWGTSAGGHLASFLGTSGDVKELEGTLGKHLDQDSKVTCVVNYFGPANFLTMIRQPSSIDRTQGSDYPEALLLGGAVPEREAVAKEASPVTHVSPGDPPFFTAHGTKDPLVPFAQAEELHRSLSQAGVPSILQEITNGGHGFRSPDLDQRVASFFNQHLLGEQNTILTTPIVFPEGAAK